MWLSPRHSPARGALLAGLALVWLPAPAVDVPPITYSGTFTTTARTNIPDQGEQTYQLGSSATLGAGSYLWQPWFATLDGSLNLSQVNTFAETESSAVLTGGDARLSVFPRSRFPFSAFVNVSDSRSQLESTFIEERQTRQLRYGITQRYTPLAGNANYSVTIQRAEESGTEDGFGQTSNFADLQASYRLDRHNIVADLNIEQTRQDATGTDFLDVLSSLRHSWRPRDDLTVDNFASISDQTTDTGSSRLRFTNAALSSFLAWNPAQSKLSMSGNARVNSNISEAGGNSTTSNSASVSVTARYELTPALRVTGSVDGNVIRGRSSSTSTGQSATVSYSPRSRDLAGFQYTHFATASASNRIGGSEGASRSVGASVGHGVGRFFALGEDGAFNLSINASQSLSSALETRDGHSVGVTHSGSVGIGHTTSSSNTRLRLDLSDSRELGESETSVQSSTLQLLHDSRLSRHASVSGSATMSLVRQMLANGESRSFPSSSIALGYRNSRLFGVRRLRFSSELSTSADSLSFVTPGETGLRSINFENRLEYSIGRVDARLTAAVRESNGRLNSFVFFSLTRRIGGVF